MKQLKKKKGFTLVELIVVIAIIAILAAIAVPTTMHFVEKANISKEAQEMNISDTIQGIIINSINDPINFTDDKGANEGVEYDNALASKVFAKATLGDIPTALGAVKIIVNHTGKDSNTVKYTLYGKDYGQKSGGSIEGTVNGTYKDDQLFYGGTAASGTYTMIYNANNDGGTKGFTNGWDPAKK